MQLFEGFFEGGREALAHWFIGIATDVFRHKPFKDGQN